MNKVKWAIRFMLGFCGSPVVISGWVFKWLCYLFHSGQGIAVKQRNMVKRND